MIAVRNTAVVSEASPPFFLPDGATEFHEPGLKPERDEL